MVILLSFDDMSSTIHDRKNYCVLVYWMLFLGRNFVAGVHWAANPKNVDSVGSNANSL